VTSHRIKNRRKLMRGGVVVCMGGISVAVSG
jgi:hypothetical protein